MCVCMCMCDSNTNTFYLRCLAGGSPCIPPLRVRLRVRIIFLRPPPSNPNTFMLLEQPSLVTSPARSNTPPLLVRRCILAPLRFEHRFAIFVLYITKIKKFKLSLKIYPKPIKTFYNLFLNSPIHQFIKSSHNS
jgi:hypothetical protein